MRLIVDIPDHMIHGLLTLPGSKLDIQQLIIDLIKERLDQPSKIHYAAKSVSEILEQAVQTMRETDSGKRRTLQSLLPDQAWDCLTPGEKRQLGKDLRARVDMEGLADLDKSSSNLAIYTKR